MRRYLCVLTLISASVSVARVSAQSTTTTPGLSLRDTLAQVVTPTGSPAAGEAIALATSLEVNTAPLANSSGGFVFKLDPTTGLQVRTATTFGPSFAERALVSGEGKVSVAAHLTSTAYTNLGDLKLDHMQLGTVTATDPRNARAGFSSLSLSATTLVMSGTIGVTDAFDLGVAVPMIKIKLDGLSWVENGNGDVILRAVGSGTSSGIGDIAAFGKYRFFSFGSGVPDPGGLAVEATVHLPTGDSANFRGLGITRTLVSIIASSGKGRIRPHVNAGYEWWSDGVPVVTDFNQNTTINAKDQIRWVAGLEFEAVPRLTLLVDILGQKTRHAGVVGFRDDTLPPNPFGATSSRTAVALPDGINKLVLIPGLKLNVKGNLLASLNVLTTLKDNGLHARLTPVASLDLTF